MATTVSDNINIISEFNKLTVGVDVPGALVATDTDEEELDSNEFGQRSSLASTVGEQTHVSQMEQDEDYPKSMQEELNEILEAWYELRSEEDIRKYERHIETVTGRKIAENALQEGEEAPDFELPDQDGEVVQLEELCQKGPVVLVFYRGKWCPHCNVYVRAMQRIQPQMEALGAQVVCISPMLPDGTHFMATKMCLGFPVVSDVGNKVAKSFNIAFEVHEDLREDFLKWGEDIPAANGDFTWEIPLSATYIINTDRTIAWAFLDNDSGVRAEPQDILANIPRRSSNTDSNSTTDNTDNGSVQSGYSRGSSICSKKDKHNRRTGYVTTYKRLKGSLKSSFKTSKRKLFGKKKDQEPMEFIMSKMP